MKPSHMPINEPVAEQAPQPSNEFVIAALHEENRSLYDNKLYLLALIKQIQAEFRQARELWATERASLVAGKGVDQSEEPQ
jgi:hypothetical protein